MKTLKIAFALLALLAVFLALPATADAQCYSYGYRPYYGYSYYQPYYYNYYQPYYYAPSYGYAPEAPVAKGVIKEASATAKLLKDLLLRTLLKEAADANSKQPALTVDELAVLKQLLKPDSP